MIYSAGFFVFWGFEFRRFFAYRWEVMSMTRIPKEEIIHLRRDGFSYSKIAVALCISENTVKSFCRRNNLGGVFAAVNSDKQDGHFCRQCGKPLTASPQSKTKHFCSDRCRMAWWNAHPEAVSRKAIYRLTCAFCSQEFESYGNKSRKYCSRACYGKSKVVCHE
jgi:endogenous inhibitor of DNA gyrase (YacG/DUF329 family)